MKTLYFDCFAGASGNMILGGLVSLGVSQKQLIEQIAKLNISNFDIEFTTVNRSGINSIHAKTIYEEEKTHRHFSDIEKIINDSDLSESIKARSLEIFRNLAKAEAKVHGIDFEKVHFHEVGAMDAIIDVVGTCVSFEILEIEKFICSKIHVGSGFVNIAHGKYPVPPPAVAELLNGIPIYSTEVIGELITPTGAAIIATVCDEFGGINSFQTDKIGYGAGTREYDDFPNALRLMLGENETTTQLAIVNEQLTIIETNLDDISSEILGFVMEKAFEIGALDCWFTPIQMKKNRPATMISILCETEQKDEFAELLYTETSTLGIRINQIERECLKRQIRKVDTEFGEIEVKFAEYKGKVISTKIEFEHLKEIALKNSLSIKELNNKLNGVIQL